MSDTTRKMEMKREVIPDDGRHDICDCGHNRNWHEDMKEACVSEPDSEGKECPCLEFTLEGSS